MLPLLSAGPKAAMPFPPQCRLLDCPLVILAWSCVSGLLASYLTAGGRTGASDDAHIPAVAAAVDDDVMSAHFEGLKVSELVIEL